jgi:hypothetical protein
MRSISVVKYKAKSGDVLNDADRFERILDWTLFTAEQETMLWSNPSDWKPGDFMFEHPGDRYDRMGEYVRPMVQEILPDRFNSLGPLMVRTVRCVDCSVNWIGEDPCWVCGEVVPETARRQPFGDQFSELGYVRQLHGLLLDDSDTVRDSDFESWMSYNMRRMFDENLYRAVMAPRDDAGSTWLRTFTPRPPPGVPIDFTPNERNMRGLRPQYVIYDEATVFNDFDTDAIRQTNRYAFLSELGEHRLMPISSRNVRIVSEPEVATLVEPVNCGERFGDELFDPSAPPVDTGGAALRLLRGVDITAQRPIATPVFERRNPNLERYLAQEREAATFRPPTIHRVIRTRHTID